MNRLVILAGVIAVFVLAGCGKPPQDKQEDRRESADSAKDQAGKPREAKKEKIYKTPQEALDAYVAAANAQDKKAELACCAPESITKMAGQHAFTGIRHRTQLKGSKPIGGGGDPELLNQALNKHGLTEEATKGINRKARGKERDEAIKTLLGLIKDPISFIADYERAEAVMMHGPKKPKPPNMSVKIKDVKITGDKATITGDVKQWNESGEGKLDFVKVGEGWKLAPVILSDEPEIEEKRTGRDR